MKKLITICLLMATTYSINAQSSLYKGVRTWKTISTLMGETLEKTKILLKDNGMVVSKNVKDEATGIEVYQFIPANSDDPDNESNYAFYFKGGKVVATFTSYEYEEDEVLKKDLSEIIKQLKLSGYVLADKKTENVNLIGWELPTDIYFFNKPYQKNEVRIYYDFGLAVFVLSTGEKKYQDMMTGDGTTENEIPDKPEVILVSGGTFNMGSNNGRDDEKPVHSVTLSSYSIGKYPVTVGQYKKFCTATSRRMPEAPEWGWNDKHPMDLVNYDDAVSYCNWLGKTYGGYWRLPTEAEWEYAARGGNKSGSFEYSGSNDIDRVGWYRDNAGDQTQSVGRKAPNELGLYDMSGNVLEWCNDWHGPYISAAQTNPKGAASGSNRVLRGGSWLDVAAYCSVANRHYSGPEYCNSMYGFRVVLSQ